MKFDFRIILKSKTNLFIQILLVFVIICYFLSNRKLFFTPKQNMAQKQHATKNINDSNWKVVLNDNKRFDPDLARWMTEMEKRYFQRAELIKATCHKYNMVNKDDFNNVMLHDENHYYHHLMFDTYFKWGYCAVPKVGSTTMALHFQTLMTTKERPNRFQKGFYGHWRVNDMPKFFKVPDALNLESWTTKDNDTFIMKNTLTEFVKDNDYLLFTFVRHPFERLVSAYKDKVLHGHKLSNSSMGAPYSLWFKQHKSFNEFIDLVLKEHHLEEPIHKKGWINPHWTTTWKRCQHCTISYDVVGHLETFDDDLKYIILKLGLSNILPIKKVTTIRKNSSDRKRYKKAPGKKAESLKYFSMLKKSKIKELYKTFKIDFEMFGYDATEYLSLS